MGTITKQGYFGTPPIVTNGLVLYLDAGNPTSYTTGSTIWNDMSGNAFSASMSGSVPYSGSQQPPYFSYSGGTYDFQGSNNLTASVVNEVTIVSVATITNLAQRSTLFQKYQATGIAGYLLEVGTVAANWTNTMRFYAAGSGSGQTSCDYRGSTQLVANKPYMFTAVYSKTNNTVAMYYNNLVMPATQAGTLATVGTNWSQGSNNYAIGSYRPALAGVPSYMSQYNVMIYNRALSQQEVNQNYNALKSRFGLT
jgi:hypothetical protein